jgi:hypothetical protein
MVFGVGSLTGISIGGALLTLMFRYYSGVSQATPSADAPGPFVAAMAATFSVCLVLMAVALMASLMRGGSRVGATAIGEAVHQPARPDDAGWPKH